jgi:hypothetical protein
MQELAVAFIVGTLLLLFAWQSIVGQKVFGKEIARVTEMTLDLISNICKGIYNFFKKKTPKLIAWIKSLIP